MATITDLHTHLEKKGNTKLAERVAAFKDLPKKDQVSGMEELISDCKKKVVTCDSPTLQVIKHVYRELTS